MRKIAIFSGGKGIIDTNNKDTVLINGERPIEIIEATEENLDKYFPNIKTENESDVNIT